MYRAELGVVLRCRDGVVGLSRWLEVPFVPSRGLDLHGLTVDPRHLHTVAAVTWDVGKQCFYVDLRERSLPEENLAEVLAAYGPGWERHEPGSEGEE
jgi:hypothetical protein